MRIDTRLSSRLKQIAPSSTLAITSKAKKLKAEGKDIINFAAGEPDFDTPDLVKQQAIDAIHQGFTKYTPTTGTPELKKIICEKFQKDNGIQYDPSQIVVSNGAKHSIFNALFVVVNKDDEVLLPAPYWVSYPEMVRLCEGNPRFIQTASENDFKITIKDLERHITPKTKVLIINSPSNPTGSVYTPDELKAIAQVCVKKKIFVLSDEIYEKIIFDDFTHVSIASLGKAIYDSTITVNGVSKSFSMTGWRIGYLGGPADIVAAISKLQDHSTSNPCSISQKAAIAALGLPDEFTRHMKEEFQKRRDYIVGRLEGFKKIGYCLPRGAFYIFCNIAQSKLDSLTFANRLLEEAGIAVIPGGCFGKDDSVRLSFATSIEQIKKGMDRLQDWLEKI